MPAYLEFLGPPPTCSDEGCGKRAVAYVRSGQNLRLGGPRCQFHADRLLARSNGQPDPPARRTSRTTPKTARPSWVDRLTSAENARADDLVDEL